MCILLVVSNSDLRTSVFSVHICICLLWVHNNCSGFNVNVLFGNIGIKYGFPFIIIHHVPKEVLKTEGVANVNAW